jgi:hypothetical protein
MRTRVLIWRLLLLAALSTMPNLATAQVPVISGNPANNAVYLKTTTVASIVPSTAYIDASAYYTGTVPDICQILYNILTCSTTSCATGYTVYPSGGAVIDARGIITNAPPLQCSVNPFPGSSGASVPSTILLPATSISIHTPWVLPSNTRLVGEGSFFVTTLEVDPNFPQTATPMIAMGSSSLCSPTCTGISIEHLKLQAQADDQTFRATDGIDNAYAGDASYVKDVGFTNFGALSSTGSIQTPCSPNGGPVTALCIGPNATYSGPYSDLNFAASNQCSPANCTQVINGQKTAVNCTCEPTACVQIQAQIRGLHGITCTASASQNNKNSAPMAAIYLDSYNDTIENVHVEGFSDGIVVGDNPPAVTPNVSGNTIANVTSAFGSNSGPVWNAVHICNPASSPPSQTDACQTVTGTTVSNISLFQIQSAGAGTGTTFLAHAIQDDLTGQTLNALAFPTFVGMYIVGAPIGTFGTSTAYTRFTTSPGPNSTSGTSVATPTWGIGTNATPGSCSNIGAIYTNTSGTDKTNTIFVCTSGSWTHVGQ